MPFFSQITPPPPSLPRSSLVRQDRLPLWVWKKKKKSEFLHHYKKRYKKLTDAFADYQYNYLQEYMHDIIINLFYSFQYYSLTLLYIYLPTISLFALPLFPIIYVLCHFSVLSLGTGQDRSTYRIYIIIIIIKYK